MKKALVFLAMALLVTSAGCGSSKIDTLAAIQRDGVLKVAVLENAPPHSYNDGNDVYVGSDLDVANFIASQLGVTVSVLPSSKDQFVSLVRDGTVHIALGRILDSECRPELTNYSISYENGFVYSVTPRGSFNSTFGSFSGKTVGASVELSETARTALNNVTDVLVQPYGETTNIESNLLNKTIEAYICYEHQAMALTESRLLQAEVISNAEIERYVIIFPREDDKLTQFINEAITEYSGV